MTRFQRCLHWLAAALLASCASSGTSPSAGETKLLVTLRNFKTGEHFELASQSHTDRVAYYSDPRADAARKVQTDEIMAAFVDELERQGFAAHAQPGKAPEVASGDVIRWGIEVENPGGRRHWLVGNGSPAADWKEFQTCRDMFLEVYNRTVSYQAVKNDSGKKYFDDKAHGAAAPKKP